MICEGVTESLKSSNDLWVSLYNQSDVDETVLLSKICAKPHDLSSTIILLSNELKSDSLSLLGFTAGAICFPPCPLGRQLPTKAPQIKHKDSQEFFGVIKT